MLGQQPSNPFSSLPLPPSLAGGGMGGQFGGAGGQLISPQALLMALITMLLKPPVNSLPWGTNPTNVAPIPPGGAMGGPTGQNMPWTGQGGGFEDEYFPGMARDDFPGAGNMPRPF